MKTFLKLTNDAGAVLIDFNTIKSVSGNYVQLATIGDDGRTKYDIVIQTTIVTDHGNFTVNESPECVRDAIFDIVKCLGGNNGEQHPEG